MANCCQIILSVGIKLMLVPKVASLFLPACLVVFDVRRLGGLIAGYVVFWLYSVLP